ncbi:MAG: M24 family metallopeptidase [Chloroflexota bacterium]|jgi:Xaa-Pro aminopeptidase
MSTEGRITKLRQIMGRLSLDAFLISQPESRRYLSGFTGQDNPPMDSAGYLLITQSRALLFTDGRTIEQAAQETTGYEAVLIENRFHDTLAQLLPEMHLPRIAFEGNHLTYRVYEEVAGVLDPNSILVPSYDVVDTLRAVKDERELEAIEEAVILADSAFAHILGMIEPGLTEREVAWEIESYLRKHGSEGVAFDTIVASGPNASKPHHQPSDRAIQANEPVIMDWGARVRGYCSDITRTIVLGKADDQFKKLYSIVLEAQTRVEKRVRSGMTGIKADSFARKVIEEAGYGEFFVHSTGHGVGLEIHELPRLRRTAENVLEDGMVFSVEPGIYLPGWGGIRIEDLVTLQDGRPVVLTRSPKQMQSVEV